MVRIESQPRQACSCVDLLLAQGFHLVCGQIKDLHGEMQPKRISPQLWGHRQTYPTVHSTMVPISPPHATLLAI